MMTARQRASLIAWAKRKATPVTSCVNAGISPEHLLQDADEARYAALVIVLAAAVDPVRLRTVLAAEDDGTPAEVAEEALKWAHAEVRRLREAKRPIGGALARLEWQYQEMRRVARTGSHAA